MRVTIVGAGHGHQPDGVTLALACGRAGFATTLEDVLPGNLRRVMEHISPQDRPFAPRFAASLEDAVRDAELVLDTVPDELESKLEILSLLDRMAPPSTLFVTPTRTLSIADLAACTYRPGQCFGVEFTVAASGWHVILSVPPAAEADASAKVSAFLQAIGVAVRMRVDTTPFV